MEDDKKRCGKRCVAYGCTNTNNNGVSLHHFPLKKPLLLKKWVSFVQMKRDKWTGPSRHSVMCSAHFTEDCYPMKIRIMQSVGQENYRKKLLPDAFPSIHAQDEPETPVAKRPRIGYAKRENQRILSQYVSKNIEKENSSDQEDVVMMDTQVSEVVNTDDSKYKTVAFGDSTEFRNQSSQVNLKKMKKSARVQTSSRSVDKVCQTKVVKTKSIGVQCSIISPAAPRISEPKVNGEESNHSTGSEATIAPPSEAEDRDFDPSLSFTSNDTCDSESIHSEDIRNENKERMFLVHENELLRLFSTCPICVSPSLGYIKRTVGSMVQVEHECPVCNYRDTWNSQPMIGSVPAGNLQISCGILFSGSLPSKCLRFMAIAKVLSISTDTFFHHQKHYLQPSILEVWNSQQQSYIEDTVHENRSVCIGRDGRADTPGHSAKFGNYSLMDLDRGIVVETQLVQSNEVKSSCHMEKEGLVRSVSRLKEAGITFGTLVTDRHVQVVKWVRENMPTTKHCIDVWHVAKGLKKKLTALSKEKRL